LLVNTFYNFWFFNRVFFSTIKPGKITYLHSSNIYKVFYLKKYQDCSKREFFVFITLIFWLIFLGLCPEKLINFTQMHLISFQDRSLS
jgi:NADH:ubiquinone oxidoreductase subunit 4 (subunit M)